jgi:transcription initiation factor TFIIIB Brf1 subunit/transcription initiation factor TFIIB
VRDRAVSGLIAAEAAGVTEVTLRNRSKDLKSRVDLSVSTK